MASVAWFFVLCILVAAGYLAVRSARAMMDDQNDNSEHYAAIAGMEQRGLFSGDEAKRVKASLSQQMMLLELRNRCKSAR